MIDTISTLFAIIIVVLLKFVLLVLCVMGACACFGITFNIMYVVGAYLAISALKIFFS